jgi:hypothetical protein
MRSTTKASVAAALALTGLWASAGIALGEPTEPAPPPPGPKTAIDTDGTYAVGAELQPGVYKSAGPIEGSACYWKRSNGDKMVDNGLTKRAPIVVIEPTDTSFTTSDCQVWQLTDCSQVKCPPPPGAPNPAIGPLLSVLGSQFNPGGTAPGAPPTTAPAPPGPAPALGPAPGPAAPPAG